MSDHDDLTPPPVEPISDDRRAAMRAKLQAATTRRERSPASRWVAPSLAAAAVVTIVAAGAVIVNHDGAPQRGRQSEPLSFAGGGTGAQHGTVTPGKRSTGQKPGGRPGLVTPHQGTGTNRGLGHQTLDGCVSAIDDLANPDLESGLSVTDSRAYGSGTTRLFETSTAWIICDDFSAGYGVAPTLFSPHVTSTPYVPDLGTLAISDNSSGTSWQYLAAGLSFPGVLSISYSFPDGHVEHATIDPNGLWSMLYLPTSGILTEADTNFATLAPVTATVHDTNGDVQTFALQWGVNTCAQINHGC